MSRQWDRAARQKEKHPPPTHLKSPKDSEKISFGLMKSKLEHLAITSETLFWKKKTYILPKTICQQSRIVVAVSWFGATCFFTQSTINY